MVAFSFSIGPIYWPTAEVARYEKCCKYDNSENLEFYEKVKVPKKRETKSNIFIGGEFCQWNDNNKMAINRTTIICTIIL